MSSVKDQLSISKNESTNASNKSLDSSQSDDSFKSSRTSTSNQNISTSPNDELDHTNDSSNKDISKDNSKDNSNGISKDNSNDISTDCLNESNEVSKSEASENPEQSLNDNSNDDVKDEKSDKSSKVEPTESTPSSSSIDLEQLISNLEISDENNELTNSLINLIHKRTSMHESIKYKLRSQAKKMSIVSLDMDGVVDFIKEKKCSNIIVMIGAGVSTSAGIPDFRSPDSGIFSKLRKYKLSSPECIFEINYFKKNPKPFFELGAEIFTSKRYKPTPTHYFIKLLDQKGLLLRLYSQNIDGLEADAGLSDEKVTYAHGSFNKSHCLACNQEYDFQFIKKFMSQEREEVLVPRCEKCNKKSENIIKPDIIFYGQRLPSVFFDRLEVDFPECDLLLVIGTSLKVQPFAGLVNEVKPNVPRILINRERTGEFLKYDRYLNMRTGATEKCNDRDIFLQGDSDSIILDIAEKLGWKDELENLMNSK